MTELQLQDAIEDVLKNEVFSALTIFEKDEMKFFTQEIPESAEFEDEEEEEKYFPCCIIKLKGGEMEDYDDPQLTKVDIIIALKDWEADRSGYRKLVVIITRIRDYFLSVGGIKNQFRLMRPIKWDINDEVMSPYFIGSISTIWQTPVIGNNEIQEYL
jgi:hypothetical protein|nr:MAG TPA: tail completion protein [Caudoviricetes sp.]